MNQELKNNINKIIENEKLDLDVINLSITEKNIELKKVIHENNDLLNKIDILNVRIKNLEKFDLKDNDKILNLKSQEKSNNDFNNKINYQSKIIDKLNVKSKELNKKLQDEQQNNFILRKSIEELKDAKKYEDFSSNLSKLNTYDSHLKEFKVISQMNQELKDTIKIIRENYQTKLDAINSNIVKKDNEFRKVIHENNALLNKVDTLNSNIICMEKSALKNDTNKVNSVKSLEKITTELNNKIKYQSNTIEKLNGK